VGRTSARTQNVAASIGKNTFFGVVASVVQVGTRFVTVPIVIYHLGLGGYGIWSIIMVAVSYMRLGAMGLKAAFQKYVAESTYSGNFEQASKLLSTGSAGMALFSLFALLPIAIFSRPLAHILSVPPQYLHSAAGGITLLAAGMMITPQGAAYDAIVCGAHRIDLARKFNTVLCVLEAASIITLLHLGFGLMAMSAVMMTSGLIYILLCYLFSRKVLPQVTVKLRYVTKTVVQELVRFAGSFQLLNIMEVIYGAMLPIAILRGFGAEATGVLALCGRLVSPVVMCLYALMIPMLSGSAMVFASGSPERMKALVQKGFKATLAMSLVPLVLASAFGSSVIFAWTGQTDPRLEIALRIICLSTLFAAFSMLSLILYRASGRALVDNLREVLRIGVLLPIVIYARQLGFAGALAGVAGAEFVGMTFMLFALRKAGVAFEIRKLVLDLARFTAAAAAILLVAEIAAHLPLPALSSARRIETLRLGVIGIVALVSAWPALHFSRALSKADLKAVFSAVRPRPKPIMDQGR
jgi:O-antigen/teichoic acid export membrane protein